MIEQIKLQISSCNKCSEKHQDTEDIKRQK